jgi:hypothetical protein
MSALNKVRSAGFTVSFDGDDLLIEPFSRLLPSQIDFLKSHKSQIIDELLAEQIPFPKRKTGLKPTDRQRLLDYMAFIDETDNDMIDEYLSECERDPLILQHQLEFIAVEMESKAPAIEKMIKCGDCLYWRPINLHGRGGGHCAAGVYPLGGCHWSETPKQCESFEVKK